MKQKKNRNKNPKKSVREPIQTISPERKRIFYLLLIFIPILFFLILETGLRVFKYGGKTALFVSTPDEASIYYGINVDVGKRYFHRSDFNPTPRKDLFLKKKPKNGFRIFVLGESTTAGFPYGNNLTFTRILNRRLSDTFPDRRIEVINTAMTAINSYSLLDFMDEILKCEPDGLLIYTGHNEYYGALGVGSTESLGKIHGVVRAYLKLQKFKTVVLLRNLIGGIRKSIGGKPDEDPASDPMATEMSRIVKEKEIPFQSRLYELGKEQFRKNFHDILKKAKDANVPVLIGELVSNIRDQKPFVSVSSDTLPRAEEVFAKARRFEAEGNIPQAHKMYYRAKDLDALRFRAPEEFNEIIHNLAAEFMIPVVPMESCFEAASPNGLIGNTLMWEHLHPNIDGYFLMADAFYQMMRKQKWIGGDWQTSTMKPDSDYRRHWGFTRLDSVYAALNIRHLKGGWPFKKSGPNRAFDQFRPQSIEDSIAIDILKNAQSTLEMGHIQLAKYYENRGDFERAFQEYRALIFTVPFLDLFYEPAFKILVSTEQYARALALSEEGLKYNQSGFIYKWAGQLSLVTGAVENGIGYLETAGNLLPRDTQVLYNLTRAYYNTRQLAKGDALMSRLRQLAPNTSEIRELENFRKQL